MTRIEVILFRYEDLAIPYVSGDLVGDGSGITDGYVAELFQRIAQEGINISLQNGTKPTVDDKTFIITPTQMAAMIGRKPETIEEALEILAQYE